MDDRLALRRHLYERADAVGRRERRALRRQAALLAAGGRGPDGGAAGVREPRRPAPTRGPARA